MGDTNFDIKFSGLPPHLQMKLWVLGVLMPTLAKYV